MTDNSKTFLTDTLDEKTIIALNLFWTGFIIYTVSYAISSTEHINDKVINGFQILGLLLLVPSSALLIRFRIESKYLRALFILYYCWLISVMMRGFEFDYLSLKNMLFNNDFGIFLYFVPLIILFPRNILYFKKLFDVIVILSLVFIIYDVLFLKELLYRFGDNTTSQGIIEIFSRHLSLPCGFLLLTFIYNSKIRNLFALFIIVLTFLLAVIRARRGLIFMSFTMLTFSYFIYQYANKTKVINIVLSLFLVSFISFMAVKLYTENRNDTFSLITERIGQQTRTEVEQYFYKDMTTKDWIIGRGINAKYFCPGVTIGIGEVSIYRRVIETGYLQMILNGGIISLGLLLLMAIPAIFKGLFNSKNILSKAAGIWILLFLLYMYPATPFGFSLNYILVWISIGICYSSKLRGMSDDTIKEIFSVKKKIFRANDQPEFL